MEDNKFIDKELNMLKIIENNKIVLLQSLVGSGGIVFTKKIIEKYLHEKKNILIIDSTKKMTEEFYYKHGDYSKYKNNLILIDKHNSIKLLQELMNNTFHQSISVFINDIEFFWNIQTGLELGVKYHEDELTKTFIDFLLFAKKNKNNVLMRTNTLNFFNYGRLSEILISESTVLEYSRFDY